MTGKAFLKRLMFQLDFLSQEEQKTVVSFYEKKLAGTKTPAEEEAMVKTFGLPEHVASKLKETYMLQKSAETQVEAENLDHDEAKKDISSSEFPVQEAGDEADASIPDSSLPADENLDYDESEQTKECADDPRFSTSDDEESASKEAGDDAMQSTDALIFTKPAHAEKAPEIVQSMENKEVKTLYGEKVIIESQTQAEKENLFEPMDAENGLTIEEIDQAKQETLEKAKSYNTAAFGVNPSTAVEEQISDKQEYNDDDVKEYSSENITHEEKPEDSSQETDVSDASAEDDERYFDGVFNKMFANSSLSSGVVLGLKILLSVLIAPLLLLFLGAGVILYAATTFVILCCAAVLFVIMAICVIAGLVELIYGILLLFETVSVALIEIGVGTVLFSIVTAAVGLIYEFLFGFIPRSLKFITRLCSRYLRHICSWLYGGRA